MTTVDLELATTDQIVEELAKRFDGILLAHVGGVKAEKGTEAFSLWYRGGFTLACGLAHRCATQLDHDAADMSRMVPYEDDEAEEDDDDEA